MSRQYPRNTVPSTRSWWDTSPSTTYRATAPDLQEATSLAPEPHPADHPSIPWDVDDTRHCCGSREIPGLCVQCEQPRGYSLRPRCEPEIVAGLDPSRVLYGLCARCDRLTDLAGRPGVLVVEDASERLARVRQLLEEWKAGASKALDKSRDAKGGMGEGYDLGHMEGHEDALSGTLTMLDVVLAEMGRAGR